MQQVKYKYKVATCPSGPGGYTEEDWLNSMGNDNWALINRVDNKYYFFKVIDEAVSV